MEDDIVCLLQDLGRENAINVIANFIIRNPDIEDSIAAKMGSLLSTNQQETTTTQSDKQTEQSMPSQSNQSILRQATNIIPNAFSLAYAGLCNGSHKMIFVVNMDLNMGRGKQCAQVAHAALGLYIQVQESNNDNDKLQMYQWISMGQKKIVVKANNLQQLLQLQEAANQARLPNLIISDAGCTQIAPGSKTVLSIFGKNEELDKITGSLRLL